VKFPDNDNRIPSGKLIASDTETTGLNPWKGDRAFCFSFCNREGQTGYVRWEVNGKTREVIPNPVTYQLIKDFYEDPTIEKIFHNAKFDVRMLDMIGIRVQGVIHDTMFSAHVVNNIEPSLALKPLCKKYLNIDDDDETDLHTATVKGRRIGKKLGWKVAEEVEADYWMAPDYLNKRYNVRDSERAMMLFMFYEDLMKEMDVREVYQQEIDLWPVTYAMESRGVRVFPKIMKRYMDENTIIIDQCLKNFKRMAPNINNFNSKKQLAKFFFEECKLPVPGYTDKGNPSLAAEYLPMIKHPLAKELVTYSTSISARDRFFGKFYELMVKEGNDYVIHPSFNQVYTATGRYSCRSPNLQNVADPGGEHALGAIPARASFGPRDGYEWWHFDFKQMELWMFMSPAVANEEKMLKFMLAGGDVPTRTGLDLGWGEEMERDKKQGIHPTRNKIKTMWYGIIYGVGIKGLTSVLECSYEEAAEDMHNFKSTYPTIAHYMKSMQEMVAKKGFIQGPMGRKFRVEEGREYAIVNYIVQGSGAQAIKRSMILIHNYLTQNKIDAHLVLTIHDEVVVEVRKDICNVALIKKIKGFLESNGTFFGLPKLPVDVERVKKYWLEREDIDL
jgi:DNA polymerase-1